MGHAFYSSGEKDYDEDGNVTYVLPSDWYAYRYSHPEKEDYKEPIILPKEFDQEYYIKKRDTYLKGSREWWDWERLRKFSSATLNLLRSSFKTFIDKFGIDVSNKKVPAYLLEDAKYNMSENADYLYEKEFQLANQFSYNKRGFITNKVNRHKVVARLHEKSIVAWGLYYANMGYYPVREISLVRKHIDNPSLDYENILKAYAVCERTKYVLLKLDKNAYSADMNYYKPGAHSSEIYPNIKMIDMFNQAMQFMGMDTSNIFDTAIEQLKPTLQAISDENSTYKSLIGFYKNYTLMRRLSWKIKCVNNNLEEGQWMMFAYEDMFKQFSEDGSADLYAMARNYYKSCVKLLNSIVNENKVFINDVRDITGRFSEVLDKARDLYRKSHLIDKLSELYGNQSIDVDSDD